MKTAIVSVLAFVLAVQSCKVSVENKPVCGNDGRTYMNEIALKCAAAQRPELQKANDGKCNECKCLQIWAPVCGSDGLTYFSPCQLACLNDESVQVKAGGFCSCDCEAEYSPVCGSDGKTYASKCILDCFATAFEISMVKEGEC